MIGVDLGGTRIKVGKVEGGKIVATRTANTMAQSGPTVVLDTIAETVRAVEPQPDAVGLAIPGGVDPNGVCWRLPNIPGFEGVNIAQELKNRLGCRVVVENDATTAALGELHEGHGRAHRSFLMLTLGTGIGGGLVLDGILRRGKHGFAGEVGHTPIDRTETGWPCGCGLRGCVESYAGTRGLIRKYEELGGHASEIAPIAGAARRGEPAATATFERMGEVLGIAIAGFQNILDLDAIVFTGGISASFDLILPSLSRALIANVLNPPLGKIPLLVSELESNAGLLGASYLTNL
jgi:glucokinase